MVLTIRIPCHVANDKAKTPAREFSLHEISSDFNMPKVIMRRLTARHVG